MSALIILLVLGSFHSEYHVSGEQQKIETFTKIVCSFTNMFPHLSVVYLIIRARWELTAGETSPFTIRFYSNSAGKLLFYYYAEKIVDIHSSIPSLPLRPIINSVVGHIM